MLSGLFSSSRNAQIPKHFSPEPDSLLVGFQKWGVISQTPPRNVDKGWLRGSSSNRSDPRLFYLSVDVAFHWSPFVLVCLGNTFDCRCCTVHPSLETTSASSMHAITLMTFWDREMQRDYHSRLTNWELLSTWVSLGSTCLTSASTFSVFPL